MKIKLLSLILLTLSLSLSACGVKVFKSKAQSPVNNVDITRPPEIVITNKEIINIKSNKDEAISYEEWIKKNSLPEKEQ